MGKCKETNTPLQITLPKLYVEQIDLICQELNKNLEEGEKKFTRSMVIISALNCLIINAEKGVSVPISKA